MTTEPSYPKDAAVGDPAPLNETLGVAVSAKETEKKVAAPKGNTRTWVAGAAVGVGSAALVAALLYSNRSRRGDKTERTTTTPAAPKSAQDKLPAYRSDLTDHPDR